MSTEIRIVFRQFSIKRGMNRRGSGRFKFRFSVNGMAIGDGDQVFRVVSDRFIALDANSWKLYELAFPDSHFRVEMQIVDADASLNINYGTITHVPSNPWLPQNFRSENINFTIEWGIERRDADRWVEGRADEIFACRETEGSTTCTTVNGSETEIRFELHPVYNFPSSPENHLPVRPISLQLEILDGSILPVIRNIREDEWRSGVILVPSDSPINVIPNPPVIPILSNPTNETAAHIKCTYYFPHTMNFTENDSRLVWSILPLSSGEADFLNGRNRGTNVQVFGRTEGEVTLEVCLNGNVLLASYRALVRPIRSLPCRFNLLNGPTANSQLRTTPSYVLKHLDIVNRYLRQMAIELTPDNNLSTTDSHTQPVDGFSGIFNANVAAGLTRNVSANGSQLVLAGMMNHRPGVMNFSYIRSSLASDNFLGINWVRPRHPRGQFFTDNGMPSTSWVKPSGVLPDAAAKTVRMKLVAEFIQPGHPRLFSMLVTEDCGDPDSRADLYATTIVHEFGHILNLGHRNLPDHQEVTIFNDLVHIPPVENVMFWADSPRAQFFDIIQAAAAHESVIIASHSTISTESQP